MKIRRIIGLIINLSIKVSGEKNMSKIINNAKKMFLGVVKLRKSLILKVKIFLRSALADKLVKRKANLSASLSAKALQCK